MTKRSVPSEELPRFSFLSEVDCPTHIHTHIIVGFCLSLSVFVRSGFSPPPLFFFHTHIRTSLSVSVCLFLPLHIYIIDIYLDVVIVVTQEFRSSFRLLLQTTELLVDTVFPLLLLTCGRCVLFFDVVEKNIER